MPQWRKLHTKITESPDVNDMPDDFTRLLWVLLPTQLCREGRGVDNPSWVRSRVFPLREDVTLQMVSAALTWFERRGMIVRYQVEGRGYFCVPTFHRYQGNTSKEAESEYPAPPEEGATEARPTPELVQSESASDADVDADADTELGTTPQTAPAPAPATEPEAKKGRSRKDPRTDHVAIQAIRSVTGRLPPKPTYDRIIREVGGRPDVKKMRECFEVWVSRHNDPLNLDGWLFDWYFRGIRPQIGASARGSPTTAPAPQADEERRRTAIEANRRRREEVQRARQQQS